jgi:hypothetical protein
VKEALSLTMSEDETMTAYLKLLQRSDHKAFLTVAEGSTPSADTFSRDPGSLLVSLSSEITTRERSFQYEGYTGKS